MYGVWFFENIHTWSVALHRSETWTMEKQEMQKIEAFENVVYRG